MDVSLYVYYFDGVKDIRNDFGISFGGVEGKVSIDSINSIGKAIFSF